MSTITEEEVVTYAAALLDVFLDACSKANSCSTTSIDFNFYAPFYEQLNQVDTKHGRLTPFLSRNEALSIAWKHLVDKIPALNDTGLCRYVGWDSLSPQVFKTIRQLQASLITLF